MLALSRDALWLVSTLDHCLGLSPLPSFLWHISAVYAAIIRDAYMSVKWSGEWGGTSDQGPVVSNCLSLIAHRFVPVNRSCASGCVFRVKGLSRCRLN